MKLVKAWKGQKKMKPSNTYKISKTKPRSVDENVTGQVKPSVKQWKQWNCRNTKPSRSITVKKWNRNKIHRQARKRDDAKKSETVKEIKPQKVKTSKMWVKNSTPQNFIRSKTLQKNEIVLNKMLET